MHFTPYLHSWFDSKIQRMRKIQTWYKVIWRVSHEMDTRNFYFRTNCINGSDLVEPAPVKCCFSVLVDGKYKCSGSLWLANNMSLQKERRNGQAIILRRYHKVLYLFTKPLWEERVSQGLPKTRSLTITALIRNDIFIFCITSVYQNTKIMRIVWLWMWDLLHGRTWNSNRFSTFG